MAAGSLVVRIGADIGDFSKKLNRMTRDVREAGQSIAEIGKSMTIGITAPVALAMGALAKMAAENEQVGNKMGRVFGAQTEAMQATLDKMLPVVDEAGTALQQFAIQAAELGNDLGLGARQSNEFAKGVMSMAASISTAKAVPFAEAMEAVNKAMMGATKGLKQFGIVVDQSSVQQEALRLGLARQRQELTPLGTALATYSLMLQKTKGMSGEAAARALEVGRGFSFVKRDLSEFADATSMLLLPALRAVVGTLKHFVNGLNAMPEWMRTTTIVVAGLAAAIGPLIWLVAKLAVAFNVLGSAVKVLMAGDALSKFFLLMKDPKILLATVAIAAVLGGLTWAFMKFRKEAEKPVDMNLDLPPELKNLLGGGNAPTAAFKDPGAEALTEFQKKAGAITGAFDNAVQLGQPLVGIFGQVNALGEEAVTIYERQKDKLSEIAQAALGVRIRVREIWATMSVAQSFGGTVKDQRQAIQNASREALPQTAISIQIAAQKVQEENNLRLRESTLRVKDEFNALRVAAIQLGERHRQVTRDFATSWQMLKQSWKQTNILQGFTDGLKVGVGQLLESFSPFALAVQAVGKVMQGLQPVLDAVLQPLVMLGKVIGIMLMPVMRPLFMALKFLGIAVSFVGEIMARVSAGIATAIGKLLVGIGNLLNKLPGSIGNPIKRAGEGILSFAKDSYATADQLQRARKELQGMSFDEAVNGVNALGDAANTAAESLTNLPDVFKISLARFNATSPIDDPRVAAPRTTGGSTATTPAPVDSAGPPMPADGTAVEINLDGRKIAQVTWSQLRSAAQAQFGDPRRITDVVTV